MAIVTPSRRLRSTPFTPGVEAAGVKAYTAYNRMLLATMFRSLEEDYHHLKSAVQVWDVGCERQVEVRGPDAEKLVQLLTPRDLVKMKENTCFYVPVIDQNGGMLNDPVALRPDEDRWWISIADSDLLHWVKGIGFGMGLNVTVEEPEVWPLAVQGPQSETLMARVLAMRCVTFGSSNTSIWNLAAKSLSLHGLDIRNRAVSKFTLKALRMECRFGMRLWKPVKILTFMPAGQTSSNAWKVAC